MELHFIYKRCWGRDRFYAHNETAKGLVKAFNQSCLSLRQIQELKKVGFSVELFEEPIELD